MLDIVEVTMEYPNGTRAVDGIDLHVDAGEIVALIGGSGCGKSTLLRLAAGLETPTGGSVAVAGTHVDGPSESVGVVFQEPRLMPWLSVSDNVAFGLGHLSSSEAEAVSRRALERVGLAEFASALPRELSGGMAQRASLARALVGAPEVLLLDEPFSALDALTRSDLQQHLLDLWAADRPTLFVVTHDIDEALLLADTVVVMAGHPGRIVDTVTITDPRPRWLAAPDLVATRDRVLTSLSGTPV